MDTRVELAIIARVAAHRDFLDRSLVRQWVKVVDTPFGQSNPVHCFDYQGTSFAVLSRHGEDGYRISAPFVNDRANLYALKHLGVEKILGWCAPGAVTESMSPGSLVVPHDILDETRMGPYTFFEGRGLGFIRQNQVFCPNIRERIIQALASGPFPLHPGGVYTATTGPRIETPAEVRKIKLLGGDLVGMTLVPEVFLARELELCYAALCYVVNYAEGIRDRPYQAGVLFEGLASPEEIELVKKVEASFADIVLPLVTALASVNRDCPCPSLMERYRIRGDIKEDWHTWLS